MNAHYVSVWDDDIEIKTPCKFDHVSHTCYDIDTSDADISGLDIRTDEYCELPDGTQYRECEFIY